MKSLVKLILRIFPRPLLIWISHRMSPINRLIFKGNKYTDPIDGSSYRTFLPYGYHRQRANALSPGTLSLERHRLLWLYLQQQTPFFDTNISLLHVAPEQPFYKKFRKMSNLKYLTTDLYSPLADVKADLTQLPFEDNCYDVIFCNHVLEHIQDDRKAMRELYRVMKPNGWGVFQVPIDYERKITYEDDTITDPKERAIHFEQYDHVRIYGMDFFDRLASVGFEVEKSDFVRTLSAAEIERYGLDINEIIPVCRKK